MYLKLLFLLNKNQNLKYLYNISISINNISYITKKKIIAKCQHT